LLLIARHQNTSVLSNNTRRWRNWQTTLLTDGMLFFTSNYIDLNNISSNIKILLLNKAILIDGKYNRTRTSCL
jgi:hypothetical protein